MDITIAAVYTRLQFTVAFVADSVTVKTMTVDSGYLLTEADYPSFPEIEKILGTKAAEAVGWWQNKYVVKGVMALKGAIYDCGGALTGAYAKEVALTKGYQYLFNV